MAVERITGSGIFEKDKRLWIESYRNGIVAVETRYLNTGAGYCTHFKKPTE